MQRNTQLRPFLAHRLLIGERAFLLVTLVYGEEKEHLSCALKASSGSQIAARRKEARPLLTAESILSLSRPSGQGLPFPSCADGAAFMADWKASVRDGGSLRQVSLDDGVNGWASPPGEFFNVRGLHYFSKKQKVPASECLLQPLGVDWLKSHSKLDHVLSRPDNRVMQASRAAQAQNKPPLKTFIFAVNLQVPGREQHSAVFYFVTEEAISHGSLLHQFIHGDDVFRNSRFKLVNKIVKGPWIVRATVGNHASCLLGKALTCNYFRGSDYLEIDVDIGSSSLASAILHLALGYVNTVTVDMAFLVESHTDEELPERIFGASRLSQIEMSAAVYTETYNAPTVHHCVNSESSWRKFSRSISLLGHAGKPSKVEVEQVDQG